MIWYLPRGFADTPLAKVLPIGARVSRRAVDTLRITERPLCNRPTNQRYIPDKPDMQFMMQFMMDMQLLNLPTCKTKWTQGNVDNVSRSRHALCIARGHLRYERFGTFGVKTVSTSRPQQFRQSAFLVLTEWLIHGTPCLKFSQRLQ